ncbi:hypothetical protein KDA_24060 [Dictyobacter alpinus]|uniref:GAF domain-containing protein n=1 Tax=Dictyobacter alpinus TaxID=2014873 RepID=A0A402B6F0_9CHLR|nr:hypothetical protein [Dictyobacter alpinus]GCE26922.1 hypothetical protein KDA_24060 [Dictyobacter alpinus]
METTWRHLLGQLVSDPHEQQRIIEALNINAMTLRRWITGETNPRPQNLRLLLNALPNAHKQLLELLALEFPFITGDDNFKEELNLCIPITFYEQLMSSYVNVSQHLRSSTMSELILQQLLKQLDMHQEGILVFIAQCVPPIAGQKIRSLRIVSSRGTEPLNPYLDYHQQFSGAESLVGYAVSAGHLTALQSRVEILNTFPVDQLEVIESAVAAPIVLADQTVGGIYIASTREAYFSSSICTLIQKYVEVLCLAFEKDEFYPLSEIALGVMPSRSDQMPYLVSFQRRVMEQIVRAAHENRIMTRIQAEKIAWQELEEELLRCEPPHIENN